jgi:uncharacterized protein (DUF885 family)
MQLDRRQRLKRSVPVVLAVLVPALLFAQASTPMDLAARQAAFDALLQEQWEYTMRTAPEFASALGDSRYNDRLSDYSEAFVTADLRATADFLKRFEAIDTTGFPQQEQLSKRLMVRSLRLTLEGARFKDWEMPVLQNSGIHLDLPQLVRVLAFKTVKDYQDYLARLHQVPRAFDQVMEQMRAGMRDGLMPPQFLLAKVVRQCEDIANAKPADSPFAQPLMAFPATFSKADIKRLRTDILAAIRTDVNPAYRKMATFVRDEYAPKGRKEVGLWSLPDGAARYAFDVKSSTTTNLSPEEIHQLGLREVKRIEEKMLVVAKSLGFADIQSFNAAIPKNPALHFHSRQEVLDLYSKYLGQMEAKLPQLFGRLPKGKLTVVAIQTFREKEAAGANYVMGTADGSRPGHVEVNTGDFAERTTLNVETTAFHEGVPGHHLQIAIAQELPELPPFRQHGAYVAYDEGWALYAERLGEEVGLFTDPYSMYGHLEDEMLRAIRLVVDTGLHEKHWTRQQVVDFFHAHSGIDEVDLQSETDRYIVWPGQALGYKVGQLKILELREAAKQQLGPKFDIRAFHDEVLGAGALPLDVLEENVQAWVKSQGAAGAGPGGAAAH